MKIIEPTFSKGPTRYWTWWTWCRRSRRGRSTWPTQSPSTPPPSSSTTSQPTLEDFRWEKIYDEYDKDELSWNLILSCLSWCKDSFSLSPFSIFFRFLTLAQWRKLKPSPSPTFWTSPKNGRSAGNANTPMEGYKYTNKRIQIQIDYKNKHTKITKETERNKFQSLLDQSMEWLLSLNWKY